MAAKGDDAEHLHESYIRHINEALDGRPEGMAITTHMCRGNFRSSWVAEGGYDFVAEALFNELDVDGFFMEWDDARSGGFEPLRFVPKGKVVVLGLVTTKKGELETKDELKRRIEEATQYVDLDQLCLSPQCGFSSTVEGNALTVDQEIEKLRLVVETAEEVWGYDVHAPPATARRGRGGGARCGADDPGRLRPARRRPGRLAGRRLPAWRCWSSRRSGASGSAWRRRWRARSRSTSSTSRRPGASRSPAARTGSRWSSSSSPRRWCRH